MVQQKQRKVKGQPTFYHRKMAKSGGSHYLNMARIIPNDWVIVRLTVMAEAEKTRFLKIERIV